MEEMRTEAEWRELSSYLALSGKEQHELLDELMNAIEATAASQPPEIKRKMRLWKERHETSKNNFAISVAPLLLAKVNAAIALHESRQRAKN
jgi:hypothetical protein